MILAALASQPFVSIAANVMTSANVAVKVNKV